MQARSVPWMIVLSCGVLTLGTAAEESSNTQHNSVQTVAMAISTDDADGDGIKDSVEGTQDADGDGVPNYLDLDSDNDGISDRTETDQDLDADQLPNYLDLDSNGNGTFDYYESRLTDAIAYSSIVALDKDSNGAVDLTNSFGANGYADALETSPESGIHNFTLADTDSDSIHDYRDLDIDNDGITNLEEKTYNSVGDDFIASSKDPDSDNDGIFDIVEAYGISADQDRDGQLDLFIDENGDGLSDVLPQGGYIVVDTDGDGKPDAYDIDSDGDGIRDHFENWGYDVFKSGYIIDYMFSGVAPQTWSLPNDLKDTDGDGLPDFRDLDSNDNGLSDLTEAGSVDADDDGLADAILDVSTIPDTDADGTADFQEFEIQVNENPESQTNISTPSAANGTSESGGCSLRQNTKLDPTLFFLLLMANIALNVRRRAL